ncbi:MAG TPA: DUF4058 family protein [Gemmataceae bacterium]|nr:DUF4058 family protein [Gemmataceae bacterium]
MPLRDHFRSPVNDSHSWDEVHGQWPGEIVRHLTTILPVGFRAAPKVHLGSAFEVDVSTYDLDSRDPDAAVGSGAGGTGTLTALSPTLTVEADLSEQDEYEVRIYDVERGRQLVAAIEIVSPSNKDPPDTREVFIGKVVSLLQQGVCVSLVDLVSIRQANLYADLLRLLGRADPALATATPYLYAVTLRSRKPPKRRQLLDAWFYPMIVGQPLPTLPIWLTADLHVMLPLETSYEETCKILAIA